jgi:protein-disulfide isomerase
MSSGLSSALFIKKKPTQLWILNAVSLVGILVSTYLTQHYFELRNGTSAFKSLCNITQKMNCDAVTASRYADLLPGFPIASFAMGLFLALFIVSIIGHSKPWRQEAARTAFALSVFATFVSIPYFLIMAFQLQTYCLFCLVVDALSLTALISTWTLLKPVGLEASPFSWRVDWQKGKVLWGACIASLLISVLGWQAINTSPISSAEIQKMAAEVLNTPPVAVQTSDEFPSIGPRTAPITVVEFSDFQCPFCRMAALSLNSVLNAYGDQIRVEFRNFPLDQSCNSAVQFTPHPRACESAKAALCAHRQGRFEQAYQELFDRQASLVSKSPLALLESSDLNGPQMEACLQSSEVSTAILRDIEEAKQLGIRSTPTFYVNGHKAEGALPPAIWKIIIEKLLQHS